MGMENFKYLKLSKENITIFVDLANKLAVLILLSDLAQQKSQNSRSCFFAIRPPWTRI